jgi:hypothetical protein
MGRITVQDQPWQRLSKTPSQKSWTWWHMPVIPATQEALEGGLGPHQPEVGEVGGI